MDSLLRKRDTRLPFDGTHKSDLFSPDDFHQSDQQQQRHRRYTIKQCGLVLATSLLAIVIIRTHQEEFEPGIFFLAKLWLLIAVLGVFAVELMQE